MNVAQLCYASKVLLLSSGPQRRAQFAPGTSEKECIEANYQIN
jgi:hypothetical protein